MTPSELLKLPQPERAIAILVRSYLSAHLSSGGVISTRELTEALWPVKQALDDAAHAARKAIIGRLMDLASGPLSDCATRGGPEEAKMFGRVKIVRRLQWHAPPAGVGKVCPNCGHRIDVV